MEVGAAGWAQGFEHRGRGGVDLPGGDRCLDAVDSRKSPLDQVPRLLRVVTRERDPRVQVPGQALPGSLRRGAGLGDHQPPFLERTSQLTPGQPEVGERPALEQSPIPIPKLRLSIHLLAHRQQPLEGALVVAQSRRRCPLQRETEVPREVL